MAANTPSITLEEHFTSEAVSKFYGITPLQEWGPNLGPKLASLSDGRLEDMNAGNVRKQVLSHTMIVPPPSVELCMQINEELYAAIQAHPDRFSGFATLPMTRPDAAVAELRRCVEKFGFVGALVDAHMEGAFYDGPQWDVLWETLQILDVPIYIHPVYASEEMLRVNYRGNYPEEIAQRLGSFVFGWHAETGLHFLRLFAAGVFERFPRLKVLLGHMGEMIPYMFHREELATSRWTHLERSLGEVWRSNVWVTTSGMFTTVPLSCLLKISPLDHVLFSVDYPFSGTETGKKFLEDIEKEGLLEGEKLKAFIRGNAAKLLRLED